MTVTDEDLGRWSLLIKQNEEFPSRGHRGALFAEARQAVPALIDEVRRLRAEARDLYCNDCDSYDIRQRKEAGE